MCCAPHQRQKKGVRASTAGTVCVRQPELGHVMYVGRGLAVHAAREHAALGRTQMEKENEHIITVENKCRFGTNVLGRTRQKKKYTAGERAYNSQYNESGKLLVTTVYSCKREAKSSINRLFFVLVVFLRAHYCFISVSGVIQ